MSDGQKTAEVVNGIAQVMTAAAQQLKQPGAKAGHKTSEFWLSLAGIAAIAFPQVAPFIGIASAVVGGDLTGPAAAIGAIVGTYNAGRSYYKGKTKLPEITVGRQ
jgi:hypothetical protein